MGDEPDTTFFLETLGRFVGYLDLVVDLSGELERDEDISGRLADRLAVLLGINHRPTIAPTGYRSARHLGF